jgi:tetratricopeptide (TPR) repeat protein
MNLREFEEAVVRFSRVLLLDAGYSKKAYISVALCENQLNHAERCLHYINQCISRFPDFYEGFYFKGKLLYKQQLYQQAIDLLLQAAALNPAKPEIKLLVAECYFLLSQHDQALVYYERYLGGPTAKNARHAVRFGTLLIECAREPEGVAILEQVLLMLEGVEGVEKERVEANSQLSLAYFRRGTPAAIQATSNCARCGARR